MLEVRGLTAGFGPVVAVRGIDLEVAEREIVALVGPNGAGKTTALRAVMGQHRERSLRLLVDGAEVPVRGGAVAAARAGIAIVPQGRRLFPSLTVREHLDLAASRARRRPGSMSIASALELFPNLTRRLDIRAGQLSGGEQQMLAIARATLVGPSYVLMDEPTEGLAPSMVLAVASLIGRLPDYGMGVLVTDQQLGGPLVQLAARTYTLARGSLVAPEPVVLEAGR